MTKVNKVFNEDLHYLKPGFWNKKENKFWTDGNAAKNGLSFTTEGKRRLGRGLGKGAQS